MALLIFAASGFATPAAFAFALLYGMSNGIVTIAKGAVPLALFGRRGYGTMLGTLAAPGLVLGALAPTLFAVLLDHTSSATVMMVALVFALLSTAAMLVLAIRHRR
jgi:nitrate/nitrite transporter NarK